MVNVKGSSSKSVTFREGNKRVFYHFNCWLGSGPVLDGGGLCLKTGLCEQTGFGFVEESDVDQAFEFRPGAFDMLGNHGQVPREAQVAGA